MIPHEVGVIAGALRSLVPIIGFNRSVRWAWIIHNQLIEAGFAFGRSSPLSAALRPDSAEAADHIGDVTEMVAATAKSGGGEGEGR